MDTLPTSSSLVSRFTVLPATTPKRVSWDFAIETIVHFNYLSKMVRIHSYVKLPEGIMNKCDHLWRMNIQENAWQFSCSRSSRTIFWLKSIGIQSPKSKMNIAGLEREIYWETIDFPMIRMGFPVPIFPYTNSVRLRFWWKARKIKSPKFRIHNKTIAKKTHVQMLHQDPQKHSITWETCRNTYGVSNPKHLARLHTFCFFHVCGVLT